MLFQRDQRGLADRWGQQDRQLRLRRWGRLRLRDRLARQHPLLRLVRRVLPLRLLQQGQRDLAGQQRRVRLAHRLHLSRLPDLQGLVDLQCQERLVVRQDLWLRRDPQARQVQ